MKQISEEEFRALYRENSIAELSRILECSRPTIFYWRDRFELPRKRKSLIKKDN